MYVVVVPLDHIGLDHHLGSNGCVFTSHFLINGCLINVYTYSF
jgi:hypothetical protein